MYVVFVTFARCRIAYTLRRNSPTDVSINDDVKYDVSNYDRLPPTTTTTTTTMITTTTATTTQQRQRLQQRNNDDSDNNNKYDDDDNYYNNNNDNTTTTTTTTATTTPTLATTTTTTFWTSTSRPPCQHWPQCNSGLCLASSTALYNTSPSPAGYHHQRSLSRLRRSGPHILLSPLDAAGSALESGEGGLWEAMEGSNLQRHNTACRSDSAYDSRLSRSPPRRSRCLLHSLSSAEVTGDVRLN